VLMDEQPLSFEEAQDYVTSREFGGGENEEGRRALFEQLPSWKRGELDVWKRSIKENEEADRELREEAERGAT
jgi:hypothetical protein